MFKNEPFTDFTIQSERENFQNALDSLERKRLSGKLNAYSIINGKEITTNVVTSREDPSDTSKILGQISYANPELAEEAIKTLNNGYFEWAHAPVSKRIDCLKNMASEMRERKAELSALIIRESGKPWKEADADVAEAIDFCEYYADEMQKFAEPKETMLMPGEDNRYSYKPKGIAVVISPWNFPLAIACGMTVAALVTGNPTVLKPAEQSTLIAYEFAKIVLNSGVPKNAFAFITGLGEEVGETLVQNPNIDLICFTGSKAVGFHIIKAASNVKPGQRGIKKVIAELGGKNAIIVDDDADLDEAVKGILHSAFGFSGQKCSACSRLIIVGSAYEPLLKRLKEAVKDLIVGKSEDSGSYFGPVIDKEAYDRILQVIEHGEKSFNLAFRGDVPPGGYFVPATIFSDVPTESWLWTEEIFGPVLAANRASSFEEAVEMAVNSNYALTGAVFSRNPKNIEFARKYFEVGNLYINRGSTGALVGRQPFGGFKMSGIGSKAGGKDYLLQFMDPRVVTENTMRRGFIPESI